MKTTHTIAIIILLCTAVTTAAEPLAVTHRELQAVNPDGSSAFSGPTRVSVEGILLNNPEEWLDPTADPTVAPWYMGGQWEIFVQGETDPNGNPDQAGTAVWMGQNYANGPGAFSYTNEQWKNELYRVNRDPNTQWVFRAGDRIRVTGRHLHYNGKRNINEQHNTDPDFSFTVELVKPAVGLPRPIEITLSDLRNEYDIDIFDPNRLSGGEYYQSRRVRIENVFITDPQNWGPGNTVTISDATGRTFPVRLGLGDGISRYACPLDWIDVIGIINQNSPTGQGGYYLIALNYDGSGMVLGDASNRRGNLPGDINGDYRVDLLDVAELAANWLVQRDGLAPPQAME